jgi:hypothetical protein
VIAHRYAMETLGSKELLSYEGRVLIHDNPRELEWLLRGPYKVVDLGNPHQIGRPLLRLRDHPGMSAVRFPLNVDDFRDTK